MFIKNAYYLKRLGTSYDPSSVVNPYSININFHYFNHTQYLNFIKIFHKLTKITIFIREQTVIFVDFVIVRE